MARTTPGTRMRRELVKDLRRVKDIVNNTIRVWTPRSTVFEPVHDGDGKRINSFLRDRRPEEYPEAQLNYVAHAWTVADEAIKILVERREQLAVYYRALKAQQEAAEAAAQHEEGAASEH